MSEQEFEYTMNVKILIRGLPPKKNNVRDAVVTDLQTAKDAGNVYDFEWTLTGECVPEGGKGA